MVLGIDPLLGVPSTILDIPSYQHEYTKTPVPYADMLPVPEPPRGLVYPDSAPPVLANINAFYAGARQAQNVHTDGNHALLVSNVGGSGGGTPIKPTNVIENESLIINAVNGESIGGFIKVDRNKLIWSFSATAGLFQDNAPASTSDSVWVGLIDEVSGLVLPIIRFALTAIYYGGVLLSSIGGQQTIVYPNGLDITGFFNANAVISPAGGGSNEHIFCSAIIVQ